MILHPGSEQQGGQSFSKPETVARQKWTGDKFEQTNNQTNKQTNKTRYISKPETVAG